MEPTSYPELNGVLQGLVRGMRSALGDDLVAICLQGSRALGGFDEHRDVDFVVAIRDDLHDDQVPVIDAMHGRVFGLDCAWAQHLEGSYFPEDVLKDYSGRGRKLWYLDHGSRSLAMSDHCDTAVARWTVREHGVALAGPAPATLVVPIPVEGLRQEITQVIGNSGREILSAPERFNNRFYQGFIGLSYCRMLRALHNGRPGTRRAGAEWAKVTLDRKWPGLIDRAWDARPNPADSVRQPANALDFRSTLEFVRHVMEASEKWAGPV